ncbi:MAG: hypothetical protein HFE39_10665 [Clostridiales bacterium]|jgi:hypothetical protein|nr:hypothetical protein [Clostridiales bacterium]
MGWETNQKRKTKNRGWKANNKYQVRKTQAKQPTSRTQEIKEENRNGKTYGF